jgi:glycosyltransferase involved in cell wall biosynthesis
MNNKIIYDSIITGHHTEYISHLVKAIVDQNIQKTNYFIIVPEGIHDKIPDIISLSKKSKNLHWEIMSATDCENLQKMPLYKRSFYELNLVQKYVKKFKATEVILMYFNIFQMALIFKRPSFKITGILFLQFYRMQKSTIFDKLKYYRKYLITKLYSRNSKIKTVFILNDNKTVSYLNNRFKTDKFRMLPDPIPQYQEEERFDAHTYYKIPHNKKILLHPGAIDPRKGTFEIIESIDLLKEKETAEYAVVIVGKAKPEVEQVILDKLSRLNNKEFTVIFDNSFVSNERLKSLFTQSFAVLMPYKNPEASSGILGHAASSNKIVIVPKSGLIGDIVTNYNLGIVINAPKGSEIANAIKKLQHFVSNKRINNEFVSEHNVSVFSSLLI